VKGLDAYNLKYGQVLQVHAPRPNACLVSVAVMRGLRGATKHKDNSYSIGQWENETESVQQRLNRWILLHTVDMLEYRQAMQERS